MVRKTKESVPVAEHHGGGHITVTAQQSRYALDAVDAPASKEVYWLVRLPLQVVFVHSPRYSSKTYLSQSQTANYFHAQRSTW